MKRRTFLSSLAALSAAPHIPLPALAKGGVVKAKIPPMLYLHAKHQAERFGPASVKSLTRNLGISKTTAHAISHRIAQAGSVAAPATRHITQLSRRDLVAQAKHAITKAREIEKLTEDAEQPEASPLT